MKARLTTPIIRNAVVGLIFEHEVLIGEGDDCTIVLNADGVHHRHARVFPDASGQGYRVENLGPEGGTVVNGAVVTAPVLLRGKEIIRFGTSAEFLFEIIPDQAEPPADDATPAVIPDAQAERPAPVQSKPIMEELREIAFLDILTAPFKKSHKLAAGRTTIGRLPSNTIALNDRAVSQQHAVITVDAAGVRIEDLESRNHTFVNGSKTEGEVMLKPGDEITIGRIQARLVTPSTGRNES